MPLIDTPTHAEIFGNGFAAAARLAMSLDAAAATSPSDAFHDWLFFGVAEAVGGVSTDGFFADINARWDDCCDDNPEAWSDDPALVRAQMDVAHDWLTAVVDFIASNPAPISTLSTVAA